VRRANAPPFRQRVLERQLGGREHARVVPQPREQRSPRVRNGS
jgi:hypothetical protein